MPDKRIWNGEKLAGALARLAPYRYTIQHHPNTELTKTLFNYRIVVYDYFEGIIGTGEGETLQDACEQAYKQVQEFEAEDAN